MKITYAISLLLLGIALLGSCSQDKVMEKLYADRLVTENHSVVSPSQEYSLEMEIYYSDNVTGFSFIIRNILDNEEIYRSDDFYRLRDVTYLCWGDDDDTVWVYSGDVGTYYWERTDGEWVKNTYAENKDRAIAPEPFSKTYTNLLKE